MSAAPRLFEPFQRLHSGAQADEGDIALAAVQRIAARHGGRAWALSAPGKGATIYFSLGGRRSHDQL